MSDEDEDDGYDDGDGQAFVVDDDGTRHDNAKE